MRPHRASPLPFFIALSFTAHAAMLAGWRTPRAISLPALGDQILEVALAGAAPVRNHIPAGTENAFEAAGPEPVSVYRSDQENTSAQSAAPASVHSAPATEQNFLLGRLNSELSRHLIYPPLARERRWEGTVWLGFRLESSGRLDQIRVARGSGYDVLDQSALHSLAMVGRLPGAEAVLRGRDINMQLPVIYRLIEH